MLALVLAAQVASPFTGLSYRGIGPAIAGGRTTAVAGSDRNPQLYYAGGAGGGVFKSTNGGASWTPVFDKEPVAPIGAIAISPQNDDDVWVGTGESNPRNDVEEGDGIWHSTDGGKTWTHAGLDDAGSIARISIDPRNSKIIAVAVLGRIFRDDPNRGVYLTNDGGAHWSKTLYAGPSSGASDLARSPDRPSTLYAGIWQFRRMPWTFVSGGPNGGVYRSTDNGRTWKKLTNGLPSSPTGRIGLAAGSQGRVYALIQSRAGELWRSDDGGTSWKRLPHSPLLGARPFYFSRIYVDPANRERLINVALVLSESTDGGMSWHVISKHAGWDHHFVWWSKDGTRVAVGNDEGLVISDDGGKVVWQPYDLPFAQPYHVGFNDTVPYYSVCIGLQDDNTWCGPSSSDNGIGVLNRDWYQVAPGDGMWALYDPKDANLVWSTSTSSDTGQVYLSDLRTRQQFEVSPDAATNGDMPADLLKYRFNWDTPIAFTSDGGVLVGGNVLFESGDHGETWNAISPDLTRNDKAHQTAPGGPINLDESGAETYDTLLDVEVSKLDRAIWVSSDDGLVHVTHDGGAHWDNVTPRGLPEGRMPTIDVGNFSAKTAYIALDRHMIGDDRPYIYVTDDAGATWRSISGNLPNDVFVRSIREDPKNANLLYAGTSRGVYISFDRGAHWQSFRLNMPATAIYDLEIQPQMNDLVVAAHGRGVWILDDLTALQQYGSAGSVTLFQPRDAYRMTQNAPVNAFPCCSGGTLPANDFVGPNAPYGALLTYYLAKPAQSVEIEILDSSGDIVRHLRGKSIPHAGGMNRTAWDLAEDGPVKWKGTFEQNQGPDTGAEVVPGTYAVRLIANGVTQEKQVAVKADPRDTTSIEQAVKRHAFLRQLNDDLSAVDSMLNAIDAKLKGASPANAERLLAFQRKLTLNPKNVEDLEGPVGVRESIMDLLSRVGSQSFQAPAQTQTQQAQIDHQKVLELRQQAKSIL
jgi:photosystem II stability/assembly factor-like uncharacterized protein/predicted RNA-binding protein YlxR (DUF448 family)